MISEGFELDETVRQFTQMVWESIVMLQLDPVDDPASRHQEVWTSVDISGDWEGRISLGFTDALARAVTASMLAMDEAELTADTIADAVGELANMVGGNIKGLVEGHAKLSLPSMQTTPSDSEASSLVWFECAGESLSVSVLPRDHG